MNNQYDPLFRDAGRRHGLDWRLLKAIARKESNFDPGAINHLDPSYGIMQVSVPTALALGLGEPNDLLDPAIGIEFGARALADIASRHPSIEAQLMVYNGGERGGRPRALIPGEMKPEDAQRVKQYAAQVLGYYDQYVRETTTAARAKATVLPAPTIASAMAAPGLRQFWPFLVAAALGFLLWRLFRGA